MAWSNTALDGRPESQGQRPPCLAAGLGRCRKARKRESVFVFSSVFVFVFFVLVWLGLVNAERHEGELVFVVVCVFKKGACICFCPCFCHCLARLRRCRKARKRGTCRHLIDRLGTKSGKNITSKHSIVDPVAPGLCL